MLRDLSDAWGWLQRILRRLDRLESGSPLENSSVTNGRLRFIGGTLRLDTGALLELIGSALVSGTLRVIGRIDLEGLGILTVNGLIDLLGNMRVRGGGTINIEAGGAIVVGNVRIENGKITVGVGGNLITIDGATGRIVAGSMTIDPASNGGSVKFAGGPEIYAAGAMLGLYSVGSGGWIELDAAGARLFQGTRSVRVNSSGIQLAGLPTRSSATSNNAPVGSIWSDTSGNLYRVV